MNLLPITYQDFRQIFVKHGLEQFPVIAGEHEAGDSDLSSETASMSATPTRIVDLESWVIEPVALELSVDDPQPEPPGITESEMSPSDQKHEPTSSQSSEPPSWLIADPVTAAMLPTHPYSYQGPAIQLGFNFAESKS